MRHDTRKLVFRISDQVEHKMVYTLIETRNLKDCTICLAKRQVLISCAAIAQQICAFVFGYAIHVIRFSHDAEQLTL